MFFKFALEVFGCFTNESFWHNIALEELSVQLWVLLW